MVYGSYTMIPIEIQESSPHFQSFVAEESNEERKVKLDLLDEVREEARIKVEAVKRRVEHKHSSKIKPRQFQVADLVMRKAHPYQLENKLSPKWVGPFRVRRSWETGRTGLRPWREAPFLVLGMQQISSFISVKNSSIVHSLRGHSFSLLKGFFNEVTQ